MKLTDKYSLDKISEILGAATVQGNCSFAFNGPVVEWTFVIPKEERIGIPNEEPAVVEAGIHYLTFNSKSQEWIAYQGPGENNV